MKINDKYKFQYESWVKYENNNKSFLNVEEINELQKHFKINDNTFEMIKIYNYNNICSCCINNYYQFYNVIKFLSLIQNYKLTIFIDNFKIKLNCILTKIKHINKYIVVVDKDNITPEGKNKLKDDFRNKYFDIIFVEDFIQYTKPKLKQLIQKKLNCEYEVKNINNYDISYGDNCLILI
jgi:hypothetical protein